MIKTDLEESLAASYFFSDYVNAFIYVFQLGFISL